MLYILGIILIIGIVIIIMALMVNSKITELEEERFNAEVRATIHFRKLQTIERIYENAEKTKEPAVFTIDKIKEVIVGQNK